MKTKIVQWPKTLPSLTQEQRGAQAHFLKLWHEILPQRYGLIEKFNHSSRLLQESLREITSKSSEKCRTLEIGAGLGEHMAYEDLSLQDYTALEIRPDFVATIKGRFPQVNAMVGDIQRHVEQPDASFDRILAIHVLEHLPNLPAALVEVKRLMKPGGTFVAVIPCEGGLAYLLARRISAQRVFEKTFKMPYAPIIKSEHVNTAKEIFYELEKNFRIQASSYWPLKIPVIQSNLVIAVACKKLDECQVG